MRIFPDRSPEEKRLEVLGWLWVLVFWIVLAGIGLGLFALGERIAPLEDGTLWSKIVWGGLIVGVIAVLMALQSVYNLVIEGTIGPERFVLGLGIVAALYGIYVLIWGAP